MLGLFKAKKKTAPIKILIVDDEPDLVSTVEYRLKFAACQTVTASNGQEGLERAAAEKPDLILLDTNMPGMDGHEMLGRLRADPTLQRIPVIMLTARCESRDVAAASAYGVSDYVTKPFDFAELMSKIQTILKDRERG
ncbi:MAG: response regulator [Sedimentisphaerales bacterium]|jgi:DNA-binding response OmpR family regulator|nr:response regulator [Planctomycetota bacterium]MDY0355262.1 response regulator [Sedimentisphaerales bacterium]NLT76094.1 response regulator [Planctomycetota bacterium]